MNRRQGLVSIILWTVLAGAAQAGYVNFEVSHVHPVALTPSGERLLAVNTPDGLLEVFTVASDGSLSPEAAIPVGLEPVTVRARSDAEAWVVNHLSDTVSVVDLVQGVTVRTLAVGDEPTDVVFAQGKAFVAVSSEDVLRVYSLADLDAPPVGVSLFGRDARALAAAGDGQKVYATVLKSGNATTALDVNVTFPGSGLGLNAARLAAMGLTDIDCDGPTPSYPPLPPGIVRDATLTDPPGGVPELGLIVGWDEATGSWKDEAGSDWSHCLPFRPADRDLFIIDATTHAVTSVDGLGTTLFEVSVHPGNGKIYVPHTDARNAVRFEHPLGVQGHIVENRFAVVDPANANAVTQIDLNAHIDRASDPATNLGERLASVSQPGMLVWKDDGSAGFLTAIGSRKLFRVNGTCLAGTCIFGADRAAPDAVDVGEGPTGVALLESSDADAERLYVLSRISHSIAVVKASSLELLDEIPLHDPSSQATREGRRFLYDAVDGSGHGDAACATCHISGDLDGLAWDLGNPEGEFLAYAEAENNVRFVLPVGGSPADCNAAAFPNGCAAHDGFDPQKGPMTTQTLRGMLEPLHWRGDRATFNDFNQAFVGLMGTADVGAPGAPAGLSTEDMERFRQFALEIRFMPNPYRNVDDTMPCDVRAGDPACEVKPHGALLPGNPTEGERIYLNDPTDANQPCVACHTLPFGAGGGKLGGVEPAEPTPDEAAALFNGDADGSPHSDLKVPHLRNMYEKFGPVWAPAGSGSPPETTTGFGYIHDGSIPDLYRFFSANVFNLSAADSAREVRDIVSFMFHFPSGTRPAVGRQVTLPQGPSPSGSAADESLLAVLISLGNLTDPDRHCELTASTVSGGRPRRYHLSGGGWTTDVAGEPQVSTTALRENATAPVTFTCATLTAGPRVGGNRDEDVVLDGDDCAPGDAGTWVEPQTITDLVLDHVSQTELAWQDQSATTGPSLRYDVLGGQIVELGQSGLEAATSCVASGLESATFDDPRATPAPGEGHYYLIRARNPCGGADLGPGREGLAALDCTD